MKKRFVIILLLAVCFGYLLKPLWKLALVLQENQPIEFYARVVDQNGNAIEGARLELRLTRMNTAKILASFPNIDPGEQQTLTNIIRSDTNGWIQFIGTTGRFLTVWELSKDGYLSDVPPGNYEGLMYEPGGRRTTNVRLEMLDAFDSKKGYTFHLWKKGATEKLVTISCGTSFQKTQRQAWFSLFHCLVGNPSTDWADFTITEVFLHPEDPARKYDRSISIGGLNGCVLQETRQLYPYLAAETGYVAELHYEVLPSQSSGVTNSWYGRKTFYVKARHGQVYGALNIDFDSGKMTFSMSGYLNPAGSRILEPDADKLITDPAEIQRIDEQTRVTR